MIHYFDEEELRRTVEDALARNGLSGCDEKALDFVRRGIRVKLRTMVEALVGISRRRQMFRSVQVSRSAPVFRLRPYRMKGNTNRARGPWRCPAPSARFVLQSSGELAWPRNHCGARKVGTEAGRGETEGESGAAEAGRGGQGQTPSREGQGIVAAG